MNIYPLENGLVEWIIRYPQMLNIPLKIVCKTRVQLPLGPGVQVRLPPRGELWIRLNI